MAENIVSVELLLAIIVALGCGQLLIIGYFTRKYIRGFDKLESTVIKLKAEHCMIQKDKTGMQ